MCNVNLYNDTLVALNFEENEKNRKVYHFDGCFDPTVKQIDVYKIVASKLVCVLDV